MPNANTFRDNLTPELKYLYTKALDETAKFDEGLLASDLSIKEVLRAHFCIAEFFAKEGEGIGGFGPKDINILISAVGRQSVGFGNQIKWNKPHEKAATLLYGLIKNHAFYDANKRTALLSTVHFLYNQGFIWGRTTKELEELAILVAEDGLAKFPRYKTLLKKSNDPEVEYLAFHLKKFIRKVDRSQYLVTYIEFNKILERYGAWLENPHNNDIDVMHWETVETKSIFGKVKRTKEMRRACVLGFPGWNKTIGKGRIRHVRQQLKLTPENGVDSQAFFYGADSMTALLAQYENALRRLADK